MSTGQLSSVPKCWVNIFAMLTDGGQIQGRLEEVEHVKGQRDGTAEQNEQSKECQDAAWSTLACICWRTIQTSHSN